MSHKFSSQNKDYSSIQRNWRREKYKNANKYFYQRPTRKKGDSKMAAGTFAEYFHCARRKAVTGDNLARGWWNRTSLTGIPRQLECQATTDRFSHRRALPRR